MTTLILYTVCWSLAASCSSLDQWMNEWAGCTRCRITQRQTATDYTETISSPENWSARASICLAGFCTDECVVMKHSACGGQRRYSSSAPITIAHVPAGWDNSWSPAFMTTRWDEIDSKQTVVWTEWVSDRLWREQINAPTDRPPTHRPSFNTSHPSPTCKLSPHQRALLAIAIGLPRTVQYVATTLYWRYVPKYTQLYPPII